MCAKFRFSKAEDGPLGPGLVRAAGEEQESRSHAVSVPEMPDRQRSSSGGGIDESGSATNRSSTSQLSGGLGCGRRSSWQAVSGGGDVLIDIGGNGLRPTVPGTSTTGRQDGVASSVAGRPDWWRVAPSRDNSGGRTGENAGPSAAGMGNRSGSAATGARRRYGGDIRRFVTGNVTHPKCD